MPCPCTGFNHLTSIQGNYVSNHQPQVTTLPSDESISSIEKQRNIWEKNIVPKFRCFEFDAHYPWVMILEYTLIWQYS